MNTSFEGELQFRRYSDTSTQGQQIVFAVHGREELESFIGKEGKRFMAVLVEIGDDEQPVPQIDKNGRPLKQREYLGDLCYRAVQWCNDPEFQDWIAKRAGAATDIPSAEFAASIIKGYCGVKSRKEIDGDPVAKEKFQRMVVGPWQKYQLSRRSA